MLRTGLGLPALLAALKAPHPKPGREEGHQRTPKKTGACRWSHPLTRRRAASEAACEAQYPLRNYLQCSRHRPPASSKSGVQARRSWRHVFGCCSRGRGLPGQQHLHGLAPEQLALLHSALGGLLVPPLERPLHLLDLHPHARLRRPGHRARPSHLLGGYRHTLREPSAPRGRRRGARARQCFAGGARRRAGLAPRLRCARGRRLRGILLVSGAHLAECALARTSVAIGPPQEPLQT